ncbi:MAG: biotin--[acetyl-CoA-carboxylase] ligase [Phycisphaerales bacterium]|nr:biotin--[acetyl-CoA-carboxylase] ligase [Phycisphaerales bacterium]
MNSTGNEDISKWASMIDTVIAKTEHCCVQRVVVIESTRSTMDAAVSFAGNDTGLIVVASEQTNGRGQQGRQWQDADRRTLPCTLVVDVEGISSPMLSAIVACSVHETIQLHASRSHEILIKWPNDIVVRNHETQIDLKIAGILIERVGNIAHIGIGINCNQGERDWGAELHGKAVSLSELGLQISRLDILCALIENLSYWMSSRKPTEIKGYWELHDAMVKTNRTLEYAQKQYTGQIEHIDPLESILIRTESGLTRLPVAQAHHVRAEN